MRHLQSMLFFLILLGCPSFSQAQQLWSGIIGPSRATDWTQAGIPGGLPDGSWTKCGSTIAAYTGTAAAINSQIQTCSANQYVLLGPGTFSLTSEIQFGHKSHVVLRGSGADSTFIVYSGTVTGVAGCATGFSQLVGMCGSDQGTQVGSPPSDIYTWTAGYAQGSNQITLSSTAHIKSLGSGTPTFLFLNQDSDGYTGFPATGSSIANGSYFICADRYVASPGPTGCAIEGQVGTPKGNLVHRWEYEIAVATAINGNVVTISPPLRHPNWRSGQSPIVWLTQPIVQSGIENISIDASNSNTNDIIDIMNCYQCWVSGMRLMHGYSHTINVSWAANTQIQNNYLYSQGFPNPTPYTYGIRLQMTANNLIQNNIFQQVGSSVVYDMPEEGTVVAYNYIVDTAIANDTMWPEITEHSAMNDFELLEGNIFYGCALDAFHGSHLNATAFRNLITGWESCANGQCGTVQHKDSYTFPFNFAAYNRYGNVVGNILGTPNYHNLYQAQGSSYAIYNLGTANSQVPHDPMVPATIMRWGNYDTVTAAANAGNGTRWCGNSSNTGWSTICANSSEIPTGINLYPNSLPTVGDTGAGQGAFPASFYLSSKPSWFGSTPWPAIGPDVSNGTVGMCTGARDTPGQFAWLAATKNSQCVGTSLGIGWSGHVNAIPAMNCALNVMGMPPDGTGGPLPFNAASCYSKGSASEGPAAPTNLQAITQ